MSSALRICDFGAATGAVAAERARALDFNGAAADDAATLLRDCGSLLPIANLALPEMPAQDPFVQQYPDWFSVRQMQVPKGVVDPRIVMRREDVVVARYYEAPQAFANLWQERLTRLVKQGIRGFRIRRPHDFQPDALRALIAHIRSIHKNILFIADIAGMPRQKLAALAGCGFDYCLSSLPWWDYRQPWLAEEHQAASHVAPVLSRVDSRTGPSPAHCRERRARLSVAAVAGSGIWMPLSFADAGEDCAGFDDHIRAIHRLLATLPGTGGTLIQRDFALLRIAEADPRIAQKALIAILNTDSMPADPAKRMVIEDWHLTAALGPRSEPMLPGEVRLFTAERRAPILLPDRPLQPDAPRIVIANVTPAVESGDFPIKRIVGDTLSIEADVFTDGHPVLAAELVHDRERLPMRALGNDRWRADLVLDRMGRHEFVIEAWLDRYGSFARDLARKRDAGSDITLDLREGAAMVEETLGITAAQAPALLAPDTIEAMRRTETPQFRTRSRAYTVEVDRSGALFASWYELFPRSQSGGESRHGTFADVIARLADIREMGFDTLYLPPIHPIGRSNRKGLNNALVAAPGDPGSVYAIGAKEGGHDVVHTQLGTLDDFHALVAAARAQGMEIALDFAVQCSPDHPWLQEHPGWFDWRADGSIKYAENPPKTYEDIVNVDFYAKDAIPGLWQALADIVRFWAKQGVRVFRVDNPHTKPFAFWEWLIAGVRATDPDILFLSEAFTRPKIMHHLAKIGFSQSYTYFTWRNTKAELTEYLTELNAAPVRDFFRPHFFANTPDINPYFLQGGGRAGFLIRAALAATLSGLWGIYSGFELCEAAAPPGREEYLDSEKYAVKPRDWHAPGNIRAEIATLNRLRNTHPALQTHLGVRFYNAFNPNILYYGKHIPGSAHRILAAVSLNPHGTETCDFEAPLWEWGLPDSGALLAEDLIGERQTLWRGKTQHLTLAPDAPYRIWRVQPPEDQR